MKRYIRSSTYSDFVKPESQYYHRRWGYQIPKSALLVTKTNFNEKLKDHSDELVRYVEEFFLAHPNASAAVVPDVNQWSNNVTLSNAHKYEIFTARRGQNITKLHEGIEARYNVSRIRQLDDTSVQLNVSGYLDNSINKADLQEVALMIIEELESFELTVVDHSITVKSKYSYGEGLTWSMKFILH